MDGLPDFTVGGTLRRTADILGRHAGTLLALSALFYALPLAALRSVPKLGVLPTAADFQAAAQAGRPLPSVMPLFAYAGASVVLGAVCVLLVTAASVWVACAGLGGGSASFGEGVAAGLRTMPANLALTLVSVAGVVAASLLLVVPGLMLICRWSAALPALVVERSGPLVALKRSRDLTDGRRWKVFGFLLVAWAVETASTVLPDLLGTDLEHLFSGGAGPALSFGTSFAGRAVAAAISGAATAALYVELRRAGEGVSSSEAAEAFA